MKRSGKTLRTVITYLIALTVLYFASRLYRLTSLPIFTDEAIYIRWSQIGATDASWRFISLTDGKQPLFTWFVMAALRVFSDPLFAGRIVSVCSGFIGMIGMFVLGRELFGRIRIGLISAALYLISPFALMYDRMAIYDSMVAAISIWSLYLAVLLARRVRLDVALLFGMTMGIGMLNKTSAFFSLYLLPATLLLFDWKSSGRMRRIFYWLWYAGIAAILSQCIYSILRLSPYFYIIAQKNTIFVYPFRDWIGHPFTFLVGNLHGMFDWLIRYLTVPLFALSISTLGLKREQTHEKLLLLAWWFVPFIALALFGKVLYPRFILFMAMPLLILAAYGLDRLLIILRNGYVKAAVILMVCGYALYMSYSIVSDIKTAVVPKSDIGQYINDWPSGWGVKEIADSLSAYSTERPVAVYTEGTFGLLPYALEIYLHKNSRIEIHGVWPPPDRIPEEILASAQKKPTFYITNLTQEKPAWPMTLVEEYQKGTNTSSHIRLYKIATP